MTSSPSSDRPPIRPPSNSASMPRKRLFPPPLHPQTAKPLQNKGSDEHTILTVNGRRLLFKIDYYDLELQCHSPDASDPAVTQRVMTVMLAEEY